MNSQLQFSSSNYCSFELVFTSVKQAYFLNTEILKLVLIGLDVLVSINKTYFYTLNIFGIGSSRIVVENFISDLVCFRQVWKHFWQVWNHFWQVWHFHCNVVEQSWQFLETSSIYSSIWIVTEVTLYFFFSILELRLHVC